MFLSILECLRQSFANACRVQEAVPLETQMKHLGQKYMGIRPQQSHANAVFQGSLADPKGIHPVPISNFMNAQCMCIPSNDALR